jgi:chorismate dehydratase
LKKTRLGAVSYLNSRPLVHGLDRGENRERFRVEFDTPSRCAARLAESEFDLALVPSIEFARRRQACAVPGVCIASDGAAASVLLFSGRLVEQVRTVAVDTSSRTSAALLRILMRERFGADPVFTDEPPDLAAMLARHDAALLIGDRALDAGRDHPPGLLVYDLGAEWKALTGLPFVFAFWAGRAGAAGAEDVAALQNALASGLAHLPEIASRWSGEAGRRPDDALRYLRENMRYRWGQRESDGLLRFFLLAGRHGLLEEVSEVAFFGEPVKSGVQGE